MGEGVLETEATRVYLHAKEVFGGRTARPRRRGRRGDDPSSVPFGSGRDPKGLGDVVNALTSKLGWDPALAQSELIVRWEKLAGPETAEHSEPLGIENGVLIVRCDSTAWATQLRLMRNEILKQISVGYADAGVTSIRFLGPNVPSFKRGPRSVQGRGVRDTYG